MPFSDFCTPASQDDARAIVTMASYAEAMMVMAAHFAHNTEAKEFAAQPCTPFPTLGQLGYVMELAAALLSEIGERAGSHTMAKGAAVQHDTAWPVPPMERARYAAKP